VEYSDAFRVPLDLPLVRIALHQQVNDVHVVSPGRDKSHGQTVFED